MNVGLKIRFSFVVMQCKRKSCAEQFFFFYKGKKIPKAIFEASSLISSKSIDDQILWTAKDCINRTVKGKIYIYIWINGIRISSIQSLCNEKKIE